MRYFRIVVAVAIVVAAAAALLLPSEPVSQKCMVYLYGLIVVYHAIVPSINHKTQYNLYILEKYVKIYQFLNCDE